MKDGIKAVCSKNHIQRLFATDVALYGDEMRMCEMITLQIDAHAAMASAERLLLEDLPEKPCAACDEDVHGSIVAHSWAFE